MIEKLKKRGYKIKKTRSGYVVRKGFFRKKCNSFLHAQAVALDHYLSKL